MVHDPDPGRRGFLGRAAAAVCAGTLAGAAPGVAAPRAQDEATPSEDLMHEHGVLKRVLLIYRESVRRLRADEDLPPGAPADAARIIRDFIQDHHERLEEDFLFPRFRAARKLVDLVDVLETQHRAGRRVTDVTLALATPRGIRDPDDRHRLIRSMAQFVRMYEPHEAREDTDLFPALRRILQPSEYAALGEDFERLEHEKFGDDGFETIVARVAAIEKDLGIHDLRQFTPRD